MIKRMIKQVRHLDEPPVDRATRLRIWCSAPKELDGDVEIYRMAPESLC